MENNTNMMDLPIPSHLQSNLIVDKEESSEYNLEAQFLCDECKGEAFQIFYRICSDRNYVMTKCAACGKEIVIYDENQHGYNGFVCKDEGEDDAPLEPYTCEECGLDTFKVTIYVESSGKEQFQEDVLEYDEEGEFTMDDWVDAFDCIAVYLECTECHTENDALAFECA